MIQAFVYPVSAVMKLWHWLLGTVLHMPSSTAWVASVVLLVITVRALISPLTWMSYKTSRLTVVMRPKLAAVQEQYGTDTTPEGVHRHEQETRRIHKEHRYNPFAGCLPALFQIPFFLGLYRLLLWMAVPERRGNHSLGLLSPEDVAGFQDASFRGVPLPAYMAMTEEQFAHLGTTLDDVRALSIPMLASAVFFTTFNLILSQLRTRSTLEWDSKSSRRIYGTIWVFVVLVPLMIGMAGMTGRIPIALLLYWFVGNLWTLCQTVVLWRMVVRKLPLDDDTRAHIATSHDKLRDEIRERREKKRSRRRRKLSVVANPARLGDVRRELAAEKAAEKQAAKDSKAEKAELARKRRAAKKEAQRLIKEAQAKKKQESAEDTDAASDTD